MDISSYLDDFAAGAGIKFNKDSYAYDALLDRVKCVLMYAYTIEDLGRGEPNIHMSYDGKTPNDLIISITCTAASFGASDEFFQAFSNLTEFDIITVDDENMRMEFRIGIADALCNANG